MTDITVEGTISKINRDRQEVFGWASITKMGGREVVDLQGDYIETDELERAAYDYVLNSRVGGEMHQRVGKSAPKQIGTLIESMVITPEKVEKMGLPSETPHGWWIGFKVNDNNVWKAVKDSKYTGFSIHGKGIRKQMAYEDIGKSIGADMSDMREQLLQKAFAHASTDGEFIKNIASIADALNEREHPEAHYFGEVVKHLIGNHEQKDHGKRKHNRQTHLSLDLTPKHARSNTQSSGEVFGLGAAGGLAAIGLSDRAASIAMVKDTIRANPGLFTSAQIDDALRGARAVGRGKVGSGVAAAAAVFALAAESSRRRDEKRQKIGRKVRKDFTRDELETLSKHLIGRHEQKDHDPTKKGWSRASHTRQGHTAGSKRGAGTGAKIGGGLGVAAGLLARNPRLAARAGGFGAGVGAGWGYQAGGEGLFNTSSKLGGLGNAYLSTGGTIHRRIKFGSSGNKDRRIKKSLTKKDIETLSNYLG
jgi:hypothetical protein